MGGLHNTCTLELTRTITTRKAPMTIPASTGGHHRVSQVPSGTHLLHKPPRVPKRAYFNSSIMYDIQKMIANRRDRKSILRNEPSFADDLLPGCLA